MNLFPNTPELRDADRRKLAFGNERTDFRPWMKTGPHSPDTLKRAIMVEVERGWNRRPEILHRLVRALQKAERQDIEAAIMREAQIAQKARK